MPAVRYFTDEDFNGRIVRGLRRRSSVDLIRVQDVALAGASDDVVLQWAADHGHILLTHDARTMPARARHRINTGASMPGVFVVDKHASIGACIDDLLLIVDCSDAHDWDGRVEYLPWR